MESSEMTEQDVFDAVARALLTQGRRSFGPAGGCLYRSQNGLKCAVGHVLTDAEYDLSMEGRDLYALWIDGLLPDRLEPYVDLLSDLQIIHDELEPGEWKNALADLAIGQLLLTEVLDEPRP